MEIINKDDNNLKPWCYFILNNIIYGKLKRNLYIDMEIKYSKEIDFIRNIFDWLISLKLKLNAAKATFKKYF